MLQKTAPSSIMLQISDDNEHYSEPFPLGTDVTWCADSVVECEVKYIRSDLICPVDPEIKEGRDHLTNAYMSGLADGKDITTAGINDELTR